MKCPHCDAIVIGAALVGPIGLVAGNVGAKKVQVTCLKCSKRFKA